MLFGAVEGMTLTPTETAIMDALWQRRAGWLSAERLSDLTAAASHQYDHAAPRKPGCIKVHICAIRKKLGADSVLHMPDRGYLLGAAGITAWRARA